MRLATCELCHRPFWRLYIIAARPAAGKSIVLAEIALHGAEKGVGSAVYSLEMSADEMWRRMIASRTGVNLSGLNVGDLDEHEMITAQRTSSAMAELPLWIDDQPNLTVPAIIGGVRKARAQGRKVGLVLVDYLQLVSCPRRRDKREQEVSEISRSLETGSQRVESPNRGGVPNVARHREREPGAAVERPPRIGSH